MGIRANWERKSFYLINESVWGTPVEANHVRFRESGNAVPTGVHSPRVNLGPLGSGDPFGNVANTIIGRKEPGFTTEHPVSVRLLNDFMSLILQGADDGVTWLESYLSADGADVVRFGTAYVWLDAGTTTMSLYRLTSCVLRSMTITIPPEGTVMVTCEWIARNADQIDTATQTNIVQDTTALLHSRNNLTFYKLGSTSVTGHVTTTITITNNAQMRADATDPPSGAIVGALQVTGTIQAMDEEDAASAAETDLRAQLADATNETLLLDLSWNENSEDTAMKVYMDILDVGQPQDVRGAHARTFNWRLAQTGSTNPFQVHGGTYSDAMFN